MRFTPSPAESWRKGLRHDGQVPNSPIAELERFDARLTDLGLLTASERALHVSKLRKAELLREVGVEPELRATGIDEEADLVAAVYAHIDDRQRSSVQEFEARGLPVPVHS